MDGRKRPAPRSRGNSPPSQRRRQSEQPSTTDRYADIAAPKPLPSPPYTSHKSIAGLPANVRTGRQAYSADERYVDQNRRNSSRDVLHGHEKTQHGPGSMSSRKPSVENSPMSVMSPMSNGSGSNTPLQGAAIVPSMLPVSQMHGIRQSIPLDTLSALRSQKASSALAVTHSTNGSTTIEVKALKAQLRAAQLEIPRLKTQNGQFEEQIKQLQTIPAQLAALKELFDRQESAAARGPSPEDTERRLTALENPTHAIEVSEFAKLQSEVQAIKLDNEEHLKTINLLREQLERLRSTATKQETDIAGAIARSTKLKTDVDGLASLRDEIKVIKEQRQAMKGDVVRTMIQTELHPEIKKLESWRTENEKSFRKLSTTVDTNRKLCNELGKRDPSKELQTLQRWTKKVEDDEAKTEKRTTTLEQTVKHLREDSDNLYKDVKRYIGPIRQAYESTKAAILDRVEDLEDGTRSLRRDQDNLRGEQHKLLERVEKLPNKTDKLPSASPDLLRLAQVVSGNGEEIEKLTKDVDVMKALTKELQQHSDQYETELLDGQKKASDRIAKLEQAKPSVAPVQALNSSDINAAPTPLAVANMQRDLRKLWTHVYGETGLNMIIDSLQDDVEKMGQEIHNSRTDLNLLQKDFAAIFADKFDPFKVLVEEQLQAHNNSFTQHSGALSKLQEHVTNLQNQMPETLTASQLQSINNLLHDMAKLKQQASVLQDAVTAEVRQRNTDVENLKKQVALKQDTVVATQNVDVVKAAIRSLQSQYENISTDEIYQKMVRWFMEAYPSNTTNMIQHFGVLQHEMGQLRTFTDQMNRIPNGTQILSALAQVGPQLITLARSPPGSKDPPEGAGASQEAIKSLNEAMVQAQQRHEGLVQTVGRLQAFMQSLNSDKSPFAKAEVLAALQESMRNLQEERRQARNEFATESGKEHDQRVEAEEKIKLELKNLAAKLDDEREKRVEAEHDIVSASIQKVKALETDTIGKIKVTLDQLSSLESTLNKIRVDLNEALNDTNKEFLNRLPMLFVVAAELQTYLEDLNMNLPKGPLDFDWTANLNDELFAAPASESDEGRGIARKGKSKQ